MNRDGQKYFFDLNNFDAPDVPEPEENLPPPPPMFTLDELTSARDVSFEEGRAAGREEEQQSRARYIATQLSELNTQILSLILAEDARERRFEEEVIHLCRALVSRLFPALTEKHGYEEIETVIARVVRNQPTGIIVIEVPASDKDEIEAHLKTMRDIDFSRLTVSPSPDLSKGCCRMKWTDGGAVRDHAALIDAIFAELNEVLAPRPQKSHNSESEPAQHEPVNGEEHG